MTISQRPHRTRASVALPYEAQRRRPARAQPTPSPLGIFLSLSTPRPVDGRPRQVGFLARGLESLHHLPGYHQSSGFDVRHTAYSCGGSPGISPDSLKSPYRGPYRVWLRCRKLRRRSTEKTLPVEISFRILGKFEGRATGPSRTDIASRRSTTTGVSRVRTRIKRDALRIVSIAGRVTELAAWLGYLREQGIKVREASSLGRPVW